MIYRLRGRLVLVGNSFVVLDVGGVGYKIFVPQDIIKRAPVGSEAQFFCYLHVRENTLELYGFLTEPELQFFELLNSVSGIGPKSALAILSAAPPQKLAAAINEGEVNLLVKSFNIGKKTAERVVLELKGKLTTSGSRRAVAIMESDSDVYEALLELGYSKGQARSVLKKIDPKLTSVNERLKDALKKIHS